MILRLSEDIVVKLGRAADDTDEYSALEYLQKHLPSLPVPRPHGLIKISYYYLTFMAYLPGPNLEQAWPRLSTAQKQDIASELNTLVSELRSMPCPENQHPGGLQGQGQGRKDARRFVRTSSKPVMNVGEFEDFVFSQASHPTRLYINFLRGVCPPGSGAPVFTHGDVAPAKVTVSADGSGGWKVVGIVGWERAGFYPDYWESVKMTNSFGSMEGWDWYDYLPECLHPRRFPERWLLDRVWDGSVECC